MIDVRVIREEPQAVVAGLAARGFPQEAAAALVEQARSSDERRRAAQTKLDRARAEQKRLSKGRGGPPSEGERQALKDLAAQIKDLEEKFGALDGGLRRALLEIPNLPQDGVPPGATDDDNAELRRWGDPRPAEGALDHVELGARLDVIDIERAARTSGARFVYLKREAVLLELALVRFALDRLAGHGFIPVVPPVLVRREAMEGTGFLPTDEQQIFELGKGDDLYLVGTSEVPLAAMHMNEMLDAEALPLRYAGFSTCFRREAGSYGKDVRGMFRVHQFDKVEMYSFCLPADSAAEHEFLLAREEEIFQALEIPYRVVDVCAGELGASAARKYDIEAWLPGQGAYREVTSCSNTTDYQARRLGARYRDGKATAPVHTLNGTAVAIGRAIIAILENHQQQDGSVRIPPALVPFCGFEAISAQ